VGGGCVVGAWWVSVASDQVPPANPLRQKRALASLIRSHKVATLVWSCSSVAEARRSEVTRCPSRSQLGVTQGRRIEKKALLLVLLFCGRSGQNLGLSGGDPPNPPCRRRGSTGAGEVGMGVRSGQNLGLSGGDPPPVKPFACGPQSSLALVPARLEKAAKAGKISGCRGETPRTPTVAGDVALAPSPPPRPAMSHLPPHPPRGRRDRTGCRLGWGGPRLVARMG
jgi:hypothetical protein